MLSIQLILRLVFVFLFLLIQPGLSQIKVLSLRSGFILFLEPARTSQITFQCLIRQPADKGWDQRINTDLLAQNVYSRISDFPGQTDLLPLRFQEDSPYYWPEQRIIVHTMSRNDFNRHLSKIIAFLNKDLRVSNRLLSEVTMEYNQLRIDSLLFNGQELKNIAALWPGPNSIPRLSTNNASGQTTGRSAEISIYLHGNFNPIDLIPLLDIDHKPDSSVYASTDFHSNMIMDQYRIVTLDEHTILHFPLPGEIKTRFMLSRFLSDHIRHFFHTSAFADSLRFYMPWKTHHNFLRVIIPHHEMPSPQVDALQKYLHNLTLLEKPYFMQWYYTQYVDKLDRIYKDNRLRLLYSHLSYLYGHDFNGLFRVEDKESIDFARIQNLLRSILGDD